MAGDVAGELLAVEVQGVDVFHLNAEEALTIPREEWLETPMGGRSDEPAGLPFRMSMAVMRPLEVMLSASQSWQALSERVRLTLIDARLEG